MPASTNKRKKQVLILYTRNYQTRKQNKNFQTAIFFSNKNLLIDQICDNKIAFRLSIQTQTIANRPQTASIGHISWQIL